jgi:hypothetical protein
MRPVDLIVQVLHQWQEGYVETSDAARMILMWTESKTHPRCAEQEKRFLSTLCRTSFAADTEKVVNQIARRVF